MISLRWSCCVPHCVESVTPPPSSRGISSAPIQGKSQHIFGLKTVYATVTQSKWQQEGPFLWAQKATCRHKTPIYVWRVNALPWSPANNPNKLTRQINWVVILLSKLSLLISWKRVIMSGAVKLLSTLKYIMQDGIEILKIATAQIESSGYKMCSYEKLLLVSKFIPFNLNEVLNTVKHNMAYTCCLTIPLWQFFMHSYILIWYAWKPKPLTYGN